jgi:hypothetical protein
MTIENELTKLQTNLANSYTAVNNKGGTIPVNENFDNLPTAINSITELKGQQKSVRLTTDQFASFYPDSGYNGITRLIVFANNQFISNITPTTSQQTYNIPSGYSGWGSFVVKAVDHNIDPNITGSNIKKDVVILGITGTYEGSGGGGGGSGYDLDVTVHYGYGQRFRLWINGDVAFDSNQTMSSYGTYYIHYKNVETYMWEIVDGFWDEGGWDWAYLTMGGSTISMTPSQTYTLTGNATSEVNNQSCLTGDTLVTMYDGSTKRIDEVEVGDIVLSVDPKTNKLVLDTVIYTDKDEVKTDDHYDKWTFSDGYEVKTVKRHRFYNVEKQAFVYMDEWKLGEHTYTIDGKVVELLKHEVVNEEVRHYKITILKNHNYFANGILTGSRLTPKINIGKKDE